MAHVMGYQAQLYFGPFGAPAGTLLACRVDVNLEYTPEVGNTTCAGDGTVVPTNTGKATAVTKKLSFNMVVDDAVTAAATFLAAAEAGLPVALAHQGFDEDCLISAKQGSPLKGEQTIDVDVVAIVKRAAA